MSLLGLARVRLQTMGLSVHCPRLRQPPLPDKMKAFRELAILHVFTETLVPLT
jgi:hypothetical protein